MGVQFDTNDLLSLTTDIVAAHISNNSVAAGELPSLILEVYRTLSRVEGYAHSDTAWVSPAQIALVQDTFADVMLIQTEVADLFYSRLFQIDPSLQNLFLGDMKDHSSKLISVLSAAVMGLNDLERLLPMIRDLGARHLDYGVRPAHYETIGEALMWALETALGETLTAQGKQAWAAVYALLSSTMIEAAEQATANTTTASTNAERVPLSVVTVDAAAPRVHQPEDWLGPHPLSTRIGAPANDDPARVTSLDA